METDTGPSMNELLARARELTMKVAAEEQAAHRKTAEMNSVQRRLDELYEKCNIHPIEAGVKEEIAKAGDKRRILERDITDHLLLLYPLRADLASVERELHYGAIKHAVLANLGIQLAMRDEGQLDLPLDELVVNEPEEFDK